MNRILIVEDDPVLRNNILVLLSGENYEVYEASDRLSALKIVKNIMPYLIVCDIMIPKMDGYGLLNELSFGEKTCLIPFIFLTIKTEKRNLRKYTNLGAYKYLLKPLQIEELLNSIKIRLNNKYKYEEELITKQVKLSAKFPLELRTRFVPKLV